MNRVKGNGFAITAMVIWASCLFSPLLQGCSRPVSTQKKPNILILSLCSIRQDHLSVYGYEKDTTPNIGHFANGAFVFKNGISSFSWVNALSYVEPLTDSFFIKNGYQLPGMYTKYMRIPVNRGLELDYKPGMEYLKQLLLTPQLRPFFLEVHLKYQHFPYIDFLNRSPGEGEFLSEKSRMLLNRYLADRKKYADKLPLMTVLLRDEGLILSHPLVQQWMKSGSRQFDPKQPFGVVDNEEMLRRWQKSAGYSDDLELLKEAYDSKLRYFDELLKEPLNLYGDQNLQENTIVVLVGDHGESFMDHGFLTHGETVYDEMLRFPLIVRFPKTSLRRPRYFDGQFYQGSFGELVRGLVDGSLRENTIENLVPSLGSSNDMIVSRSCRGNLRSVRYQNHWKLIWNIENGQKLLFDLSSDPLEMKNVYREHPELTGRLEEALGKSFGLSESISDPSCKETEAAGTAKAE